MTLKIFDVFSGIGGAETALDRAGVEHEDIVCEAYPLIFKGYKALHGDVQNYDDVSEMTSMPDADLLFFDWPTSKIAPLNRKGRDTKASLAWFVVDLLENARSEGNLPEYICAESTPFLLSSKYSRFFNLFIKEIKDLGYEISYEVLNTSDYGVPQNRRRWFMVASLHHGEFVFPEPCPDDRILKDVLESEDAVKDLWLSYEEIAGREMKFRKYHDVLTPEWMPTDATQFSSFITVYTDRRPVGPFLIQPLPDDPDYDRQISVTVSDRHNVEDAVRGNLRIRRFSPLEFWRLQGYTDEEFQKVKDAGLSDGMLYRVAAFSSAVPCWTAIFRAMFIDKTWKKETTQCVLDFGRGEE